MTRNNGIFTRIKLRHLDHKIRDQGLSALKATESVPTAYTDDLPAVMDKVRDMVDEGTLGPDNVEAALAAFAAVMSKGKAERALQRQEVSIALWHKEMSRKVRMGIAEGVLSESLAQRIPSD